ncbi:hypothetical protein [Thauera sp. Sel9]|uniref:hypothetical protein n=1 Tax=Thauera sp. Sel9 TaxID=2974299 RepID=UPI0021E11A99|nr:hypothetical protein [Thauera sp. Sel9]MCV2218464.1 hypothetical protein [Thauera sp. Sel9]
MLLADRRIELDARPEPGRLAPVEVVMIGHCPSPDGGAQWPRLARDAVVLADIEALGFARQVERLRRLFDEPELAAADDADLLALYRLPIPIRSLGHFQALFPFAFDTDTGYRSTLAGRAAWLPLAVQDFFAGTASSNADAGIPDTRTLWIIRVPERDGIGAFLPRPGADLVEPDTLGAFEHALLVPRAGILALPDLERLLVPAALPDVPRLRLANPEPVFLPCGTEIDDTHRERRNPDEMPAADETADPRRIVADIARTLARLRPDLQCLLALPLDSRPEDELPAPSPAFLDMLRGRTAAGATDDEKVKDSAAFRRLRHLQFVWPYLRGDDRALGSPCGLIAGMQARAAQRFGAWRSMAGRPLPGMLQPWPPMTQQRATGLREDPGVTVLLMRSGKLQVDDEALCTPCLPAADLDRMNKAARALDQWRSAEAMRFIGWLRRELRALGERLAFDIDPRDPRAEIALRAFFGRLHAAGALRGARPEDAFRIRQLPQAESALAFEIEVALAYPLDRIRITFLQDRHASGADTRIEAIDG